jgi:RNA polymerase sigma-70 factor (ECF subfamily)
VVTDTNDERALIAALRAGDQNAFAQIVDQHTAAMLCVARRYVKSHTSAEDVVQDTWIALVRGIGKFEGRSSLRTWLFAVVANIAKARGIRERRDQEATAALGTIVDPARFHGADDRRAGSWKQPPALFPDSPEGSVLRNELRAVTQRQLDKLPEAQRAVVTLRDMLGFDSAEVCDLLDISLANQRVLLHRGRIAIREVLEQYVSGTASAPTR